jgi:hypothetical protein
MIDEDIRTLKELAPDKALDRLEIDIWAGVSEYTQTRRTSRIIASCQAGGMVVALVGAAAVGAATAASAAPQHAVIGSASAELAPSTLLLGIHP